jgi:DNA repair protein RadA
MAKEKSYSGELLTLEGVGEGTALKLDDAGLSNLMSIATSSPEEISSITGISETVSRKIIKSARESLKLGFEKAKVFADKRDKITKITTGCESFDTMMGGGFEAKTVTEIYGATASGKSQLSHLMVVRALIDDAKAKAIFLDSESTFRPERIKDFCEASKIDYEDALQRIFVARSYNSSHQILLVDEIEKMVQADNSYKILVVDSLTSHFRADFIGRATLANRQQMLNKHLHQLLKIADIYNLVVILTNQVTTNPGVMYGDPISPIGGNIISHAVTSIVYLRKSKDDSRCAKLVDSPHLAVTDCYFWITKNGISDEKPK